MGKEPEKVMVSYPGGNFPTDKQLEIHNDTLSRIKMIEGGFGSAKSYCTVFDLAINLFGYPGNECVYGRLTLDEINRTFFPIWDDLIPKSFIISHNKSEKKIVVRTSGDPSVLHYLPLDDAKGAEDKLKSMNLGYLAIDQTEEVSERIIDAADGRLRRVGTRQQMLLNANPEGHNWIWERFIRDGHKHPDEKLYEMNSWHREAPVPTMEEVHAKAKETGKPFRDVLINDFPDYVQYTDNPYLPMSYLITLLNKPDRFVSRYVFGEHNAFEGLVYPQFNENFHIIEPFDTNNKDFIHVVSMDYGRRNPTSVHFWAVDKEGVIYCYDEIYQEKLEIPVAKMMIRAKIKEKKIDTWIADGSIWDDRIEKGKSVGQLYADDDDISGWGIKWEKADRGPGSVDAGIRLIEDYLRHDEFTSNKSKIYFMRGRCPYLISEIQDYRYKDMAESTSTAKLKNQPETPRKFKDHAMDEMRYMIMKVNRYDLKSRSNEAGYQKWLRDYKRGVDKQNGIRGYMVA